MVILYESDIMFGFLDTRSPCALQDKYKKEESNIKNLVHSRLPGVRLGSPNQQPGDEDYYYHYYYCYYYHHCYY